MKTRRAWPLIVGLVGIIGGALGIEYAARSAEVETIVRRIDASESGADDGDADAEDADALELAWYTSEARGPRHARARALARRGDLDTALTEFAALVDEAEGDAAILAEFGHWLRRADRSADARARLEAAAALDPQRAEVQLDLALLNIAEKQDEAATECFERALALRPTHNGTRIAYGAYLRRSGRLDRAAEVLQPATHNGGNDSRARALTALGQIHAAAGRGEEALKAFNQAIERAPAVASAWSRAARALVDLPDAPGAPRWKPEAMEFARRGARLAPQNSYVHDVLGIVAEQNELEDEAWEAYQAAARLNANARHARRRLIRMAIIREDWALARRTARQLLELDEGRAEYHFLNGLVESRAGELEAAREAYARAIEVSDSPYAEAWYNLGILERRADRLEASLAAYERALEIRPNYVAATNNRGLVLRDLGRRDAARAAFEDAIARRPDYVSAWVNLARIESDAEHHDASVSAYDRVLQLDPGSRSAALERGVNLRKAGRGGEAIAAYTRLVDQHPRYLKAWYNLAIAHAGESHVDEARRAYERALSLDAGHWRSRKNLGLLEFRAGRDTQARAHLREAADVHPEDIETRLALAELALRDGAREECRAHLRPVLRQDPQLPGAIALAPRCE